MKTSREPGGACENQERCARTHNNNELQKNKQKAGANRASTMEKNETLIAVCLGAWLVGSRDARQSTSR